MKITISRVYTFPSGAKIDLLKVIAISEIKTDEFRNIYFNITVLGTEKPLTFQIAAWHEYAGTKIEDTKVKKAYDHLVSEWEKFILEQEGGDNG
jgi:hypothetical protein